MNGVGVRHSFTVIFCHVTVNQSRFMHPPAHCLHGSLPGSFLLSYSVFDFIFPYFFVSGPCARLSWPSRQLLSAR